MKKSPRFVKDGTERLKLKCGNNSPFKVRRDNKKKEALVKWKGYNDDFNSWDPLKDLKIV